MIREGGLNKHLRLAIGITSEVRTVNRRDSLRWASHLDPRRSLAAEQI